MRLDDLATPMFPSNPHPQGHVPNTVVEGAAARLSPYPGSRPIVAARRMSRVIDASTADGVTAHGR
jgi:hypothetical protein